MEVKKIKCPKCGRLISCNNFARHIKVCKGPIANNDFSNLIELLPNGKYKCLICGKISNKYGIHGHIWRVHCEQGKIFSQMQKIKQQDSTKWKRSNGAIKAKEENREFVVSQETRYKLSEAMKNRAKTWWTKERRQQQSEAMKNAVKKHPESYTSSNRGRVKQFQFDGIIFQGKWELYFYQYCKANLIAIKRNTQAFPYKWNGIRQYFPDFYLPQLNIYVEIKGYETERDRAKWAYFPNRLIIIKKEQIKNILNGKQIDLLIYEYNKM